MIFFLALGLVAFPSFFYVAAETQGSRAWAWALASVLLWILAPFGIFGGILAEVGLFVVMIVWNIVRKKPDQKIVR